MKTNIMSFFRKKIFTPFAFEKKTYYEFEKLLPNLQFEFLS